MGRSGGDRFLAGNDCVPPPHHIHNGENQPKAVGRKLEKRYDN